MGTTGRVARGDEVDQNTVIVRVNEKVAIRGLERCPSSQEYFVSFQTGD